MTDLIPEELTPEQLRQEAVRRELRARTKRVADRRIARNDLVDAILALPSAAVRGCGAADDLCSLLDRLRRHDDDDQKTEPSNAEISPVNLGGGGVDSWWSQLRRQIPAVERHPMLDDNRRPNW